MWGGGTGGFVSIRSNGLSFLMFLQRELRIKGLLLPKERGREKRKKNKTNKSCENLWSKCWLLRMQNRLVEFFPLGISNAPLFVSSPSPFAVFGLLGGSGRSTGCPPRSLCSVLAIISFCLFFSTLLGDTQDLTTPFFNRSDKDRVCAFSGLFSPLQTPP